MEFPVKAYLTCVQVFDAVKDTVCSREALQAGYEDLMARAGKINDAQWRCSYLENIPENVEIVARWKARQMED
jgi:hypothetical protein